MLPLPHTQRNTQTQKAAAQLFLEFARILKLCNMTQTERNFAGERSMQDGMKRLFDLLVGGRGQEPESDNL